MNYTEAEIFEAVCLSVGDDGNKAIQTIKSGIHIKNKLSCTSGYGCEFYKTKHCN